MGRIDEILAKQKALEEELKVAKEQERDAVLKDIKEKIKLFGFKTSDFKGVLKTRRTKAQIEAAEKKNTANASKKTTAKK